MFHHSFVGANRIHDDSRNEEPAHVSYRGNRCRPEKSLRRALVKAGIRGHRLRVKLPGGSDAVFSGRNIAIFVDGHFWHGCPQYYIAPEKNAAF